MFIRQALPADWKILAALGTATFVQTYAAFNQKENVEHYLRQAFNEDQLTRELNSPTEPYFIAFEQDIPIGYFKLNDAPPSIEVPAGHWIEIQRIYLLQGFQGKGLGNELIQFAETQGLEMGKTHIWLGVWEKNPRAIRFYERNGYKRTGMHTFWVGNDEQFDHIMTKKL